MHQMHVKLPAVLQQYKLYPMRSYLCLCVGLKYLLEPGLCGFRNSRKYVRIYFKYYLSDGDCVCVDQCWTDRFWSTYQHLWNDAGLPIYVLLAGILRRQPRIAYFLELAEYSKLLSKSEQLKHNINFHKSFTNRYRIHLIFPADKSAHLPNDDRFRLNLHPGSVVLEVQRKLLHKLPYGT